MAASQADQETQLLIHLLSDLRVEQELSLKVNEDNKSCITLTQTAKYDIRIKYIDAKCRCLRHLYKYKMAEFEYCNRKFHAANILT